ncbi:MAG TPA: PHB depolymerase family esterase [Acidimicrobiia bacterium]|nr:PHB depolymerase family esterase [Acidimicrobiia bacterium]
MRLRVVATALIAAMVAVGCAGDEIETGRHLLGSHTVDRNREMPYLLWIPDGYDPDAEPGYPMIVSLHGTAPIEYSTEFVMQYGLPAVLAVGDQPEDFQFVVVSPQGLDAVNWWDRGQPQEVGEIVDEISSQLAIDTTRVYLTGISTGGQGAWHVALRDPERYAAVVSVAGSGFLTTGIMDDAACRLSEVPIWGIHGDNDLISVYEIIRAEVEAYEDLCDEDVRWTSYPGVGHYQSWEMAYRDPAVYAWLLEHSTG